MPACRFRSTLFLVLALLGLKANAGNLTLADSLFRQKDYFQAVTEYKRFLFFHSGKKDSLSIQAWFQMGLCYRNSRDWESAYSTFDTVMALSDSGPLRERAHFQSALVQLSQGSKGEAEFEFAGLAKFSPDSLTRSQAFFFQGICQIQRHGWEEARKSFQKYVRLSGSRIPPGMDSLLESGSRQKWRSPVTARWLSTALPGLGQAYTGYFLEGAFALTLNASLGWLVVYLVMQGQIVEGALAVFVLQRFYFGNREKAGQLASRFNEETSRSLADKVMKELDAATGP